MLLDRIAERVRKHQDMQSEVEADRGHQPGFPDFEILYRPGEIKLQVITQHNGAEANTIAIQPGVKEVLQLCLEGSASDDLVAHAVLGIKWCFAGPASAHIVKCGKLHIAEEVGRYWPASQRPSDRDTKFRVEHHHTVTKQRGIVEAT